MRRDRVTITLTLGDLGLLRALINLKIEDVERKIALGVADPADLVGGMKSIKAKLDRPVERIMARTGGNV